MTAITKTVDLMQPVTSSELISADDQYVAQLWAATASVSLELMLFIFAMIAYAVLHRLRVLHECRASKSIYKPKSCTTDVQDISEYESEKVGETDAVPVGVPKVSDTIPIAVPTVAVAVPTDVTDPVLVDAAKVTNAVPIKVPEVTDPVSVDVANLALERNVQNGSFKLALELFSDMSQKEVQWNTRTRATMLKLLNHARDLPYARDLLLASFRDLWTDFAHQTCSPLAALGSEYWHPLLTAAAVASANARARAVLWPDDNYPGIRGASNNGKSCSNVIKITGKLPYVKAARRSLNKHGFMKKCNNDKFQLNGHWVTNHGLTVIIEGKVVRWSPKRASRLKFMGIDRCSCSLSLYGETSVGRLEIPAIPDAMEQKSLRWDNGDVWHAYAGTTIAHSAVYSQHMTQVARDAGQDDIVQATAAARLQLVAKDGLGLLPNCSDLVLQYLGSDTYFVSINFATVDGPPWMGGDEETDFLRSLSRAHPNLGFRHCWADDSKNVCGQRTIKQGRETDEDAFEEGKPRE